MEKGFDKNKLMVNMNGLDDDNYKMIKMYDISWWITDFVNL